MLILLESQTDHNCRDDEWLLTTLPFSVWEITLAVRQEEKLTDGEL